MSSFLDIQTIDYAKINNVVVRNGYVLYAQPISFNNTQQVPVIAAGGSYEKGNMVYDLIETNDTGTIIGSPTFENFTSADDIIYNYLTCLIPGFFPSIGGRWEIDQNYYSLNDILNSEKKISKVLGLGIGDIEVYQVSDVCRSGVSSMSFSTNVQTNPLGDRELDSFDLIRLVNYSSIVQGPEFPETTIGAGDYMNFFNWGNRFGIDVINGTNTFPFFGWGGSRIGTIQPQNFQVLQNSLFSYPAFFLNQSKDYNPLGIVNPGQLLQINSFPINTQLRISTFEERNDRTYQTVLQNKFQEIRKVGVLPYQQGRGVYDLITRDPTYNESNGQIDIAYTTQTIPPEGAIPGRNNSFWGVAISDTWSTKLNINNIINGSLTPEDTRIGNLAIRNAPLCYIPTETENEQNVLPWNPLFGYTGDTTSSSNNKRSSNCSVMKEGITTGIISGAYPIYRGSNSSMWNGSADSFFLGNGNVLYDQYYIDNNFWNPNIQDPATPQINNSGNFFGIQPNPPYRIKGGRIVLFEGQRIKAGSYVYVTIQMTANVSIPHFIPPGAKEIKLDENDRDNILQDVYSKTQGNQGGLIVMVTNDGMPPPNPPSCAVPVGVVLEDIVGYGNPESFDNDVQNNIEYAPLLNDDNSLTKAVIDPENVKQIQAREILFKLFPMTPQENLNGISTLSFAIFLVGNIPIPYSVSYGNFNNPDPPIGTDLFPGFEPIYNRIKTNYYLPTVRNFANRNSQFIDLNTGWGFKEAEARLDAPPGF